MQERVSETFFTAARAQHLQKQLALGQRDR
jgi:hypothetical protein